MSDKTLSPTITVIMPTYNRASLISRALKSVVNQTLNDLEVIVVDDASTDNTNNVVKNFSDTRVKYIRHSENKGGPSARNTGIEIAKGEFIAFLDDDDEWTPEKLEKQLSKFSHCHESIGLVYCGFDYTILNQSIYTSTPNLRGNLFNRILETNIIGSVSLPLIRKDCFSQIGMFDESLESCQDWDFWIRLSKSYEIDFAPEILVRRYIHGNQITTNLNKKILGREMILNKHKNDLNKRQSTLSLHFRRLGSLYCLNEQPIEGRKHFLNSIRSDPKNWGCYVHLFLMFLSNRIHKKVIEKYGVTQVESLQLYH